MSEPVVASGADSMRDRMKPRLTLADVEAFARAKQIEWGKAVLIGEEKAIASGALPGCVVFKIRNRLVHIRAGDPRLLQIKDWQG